MPSLRGIGTAVRLGRDPASAPFRGIVLCAALSVGVFSAPFAADWFHFAYSDATGVFGWPAANGYPIQQDVILFVLAVPLLVLAFWSLWVGASWLAARDDPRETASAMAQSALSCLWFCLLVAAIPWSRRLSWQLPALAALCAAATFVVLRRLRRGTGGSWAASWPCQREPARAEGAGSGYSPDRLKPDRSRRWRNRGWRILAIVVVPLLVYVLGLDPDIHGPVDYFHEGERLVPLDAMWRGEVPYRDFYLQHGLLENALFPLLAGRLFGHTLEALRTMEMIIHPLVYVAYYLLGLSLFRFRLLTSLLLTILVMAVEWDWGAQRPLFALLALAAVASAIRGPRVLAVLGGAPEGSGDARPRRPLRTCWTHGKPLIAAGFLSSLAFWHFVDVGAYSLASIGLFLLLVGFLQPGIEAWRRPLPLLCFAGGVFPLFLLVGSYLWSQGLLGDLLHNLYLQVAFQLQTWGFPYPPVSKLLRPLETAGWAGWRAFVFGEIFRWYLPIVLYLLCPRLPHTALARRAPVAVRALHAAVPDPADGARLLQDRAGEVGSPASPARVRLSVRGGALPARERPLQPLVAALAGKAAHLERGAGSFAAAGRARRRVISAARARSAREPRAAVRTSAERRRGGCGALR